MYKRPGAGEFQTCRVDRFSICPISTPDGVAGGCHSGCREAVRQRQIWSKSSSLLSDRAVKIEVKSPE